MQEAPAAAAEQKSLREDDKVPTKGNRLFAAAVSFGCVASTFVQWHQRTFCRQQQKLCLEKLVGPRVLGRSPTESGDNPRGCRIPLITGRSADAQRGRP